MGLYNVLAPCEIVSDGAALQFVRPTEEYQPVELDDEPAAVLVVEGKLSPYAPGGIEGDTGTVLGGELTVVPVDKPPRRPRRPGVESD